MRELQRKQKVKRIIYSLPSLVILAFLAFFLVRGALRVMSKEQESKERARDLAEKVATLIRREEVLKGDLTRLETEEGIKDEIRERFSVTQEGEYVAIIFDERGVSSSTNRSALPWYKRLLLVILPPYGK